MNKYNFITKKLLIKEYTINRKSMLKIAKELGCSTFPIYYRLIKFNISRRINKGNKRPEMSGRKCPAYIDGRTLKIYYCKDCGKKICYNTWKYGTKRCASCANKKELSPNWRGGISSELYPLEFTSKLKKQIRKRDNYTCQICGMTEEEHLILYDRVLDIHHIDYDKENLNPDNLMSLCHKCNMKVNRNRDYWYAYFKYIMEN